MSISINNSVSVQGGLADLLNLQNPAASGAAGQASGSGGQAASDPAASPAFWAAAQSPSAALQALDSVTVTLGRASSVADTASAAGQSVLDLLNRLQADAASAADPSTSSADRQSLNADFKATLSQVQATIAGAAFDGTNLVDGSQSSAVKLASGGDAASTLSLSSVNLSLGGPLIGLSATASIGAASLASGALSQIGGSLAGVSQAVDALNDQASRVSAHMGFIAQVNDVLEPGAGDMVSADLDSEGARLMALQTQQLLSGQSAAVVNQAPQTVLSLFR